MTKETTHKSSSSPPPPRVSSSSSYYYYQLTSKSSYKDGAKDRDRVPSASINLTSSQCHILHHGVSTVQLEEEHDGGDAHGKTAEETLQPCWLNKRREGVRD